MKVKITKKGKDRIEFILEGASVPFANALRRTMISGVPVLAIEWVDITENSSAVFDEIIAQRLGLIPLVFDPSKFNFQEDCKCRGKGCPLCQVVFALEKQGPGTVYSGDMKSSNRGVKPSDPRFPIAELLGNQKIKLEAVARLGTGKEHAKFQAANAAFQNYPEFRGKDINTQPDKFLFSVESVSGLQASYIISRAGEILEEKAKEFKKEASKL
jgi:DNA-directed RNA polymerase subunit D